MTSDQDKASLSLAEARGIAIDSLHKAEARRLLAALQRPHPEVNKNDATDCEACSQAESAQCLFHEGIAIGIAIAKKAMIEALDNDL